MMDEQDLDCIFHVDYGRPSTFSQTKVIPFDDELTDHSEQLSSKWESLFKYSSHDEDDVNISRVIESTGFSAEQVNAFTQQNLQRDLTIRDDTIAEDHKMIFLDKKYFQFENTPEPLPAEPAHQANESLNSTAIDNGEHIDETVEETTAPLADVALNKTKKRKKRNHKRNVRETEVVGASLGSSVELNISKNVHGAPPGVRAGNFQRIGIDLTKNTSAAPRFRL